MKKRNIIYGVLGITIVFGIIFATVSFINNAGLYDYEDIVEPEAESQSASDYDNSVQQENEKDDSISYIEITQGRLVPVFNPWFDEQISVSFFLYVTFTENDTVLTENRSFRDGVKWSSDNENVLCVTERGNFRPVGTGTATITAEYKGHRTEKEVSVEETYVESISFYPPEVVIIMAETEDEIILSSDVSVEVYAHFFGGGMIEVSKSPFLNLWLENTEDDFNTVDCITSAVTHIIQILGKGEATIGASFPTPPEKVMFSPLEDTSDDAMLRAYSEQFGILPVKVFSVDDITGIEVRPESGRPNSFMGNIDVYALFKDGSETRITDSTYLNIEVDEYSLDEILVTATFADFSDMILYQY